MSPAFSTSLFLADDDATTGLGQRIAPCLRAGDCLLLNGPIGAGKTHFARAVIQTRLAAAGRLEDVPSPTFTLVQTYDDGICDIWHADLYRLSNADEVMELGLDDALSDAITLIEWPDRLGMTPDAALHLDFRAEGDGRTVTLTSDTGEWSDRLRLKETADG